jgi:hypothetical protein
MNRQPSRNPSTHPACKTSFLAFFGLASGMGVDESTLFVDIDTSTIRHQCHQCHQMSSMSTMSIKRQNSINNIDNVGNCNNVRLCMT